MTEKKTTIKRKLLEAGGWQIVKRGAKAVPYLGTAVAIGLIGHSIRRKGVVKGVIHSGLDAIPFVGTAKNIVEFFTGDLIPDKNTNNRNLR
ncbi:MAG: hypothetical protein M3Q99_05050 [Acidobacteriota bacterium]|nr:hypothetical protein [Acidobacteriota bacterium]